ncbi:hypothetical protein [Streptomyces sp. CA-106131]|uniref:hypothetical protein n=1 Tax=Streptomyces sp. CA-106131 TaxID=3240045 RepID=UPI003D92AC81
MTPLRRRYLAALRTPLLPCGIHRDPLLCEVAPTAPSSFGLTRRELAAERARLRAAGWSTADVAERLLPA